MSMYVLMDWRRACQPARHRWGTEEGRFENAAFHQRYPLIHMIKQQVVDLGEASAHGTVWFRPARLAESWQLVADKLLDPIYVHREVLESISLGNNIFFEGNGCWRQTLG